MGEEGCSIGRKSSSTKTINSSSIGREEGLILGIEVAAHGGITNGYPLIILLLEIAITLFSISGISQHLRLYSIGIGPSLAESHSGRHSMLNGPR